MLQVTHRHDRAIFAANGRTVDLRPSVPCLLVLIRAEADPGSRRLWWLMLLIPLILFCIELRTIGIVFIPAFIWAAIGGVAGAVRIYPTLRRHRFITFAFLLVALVMVGRVLLDSRYMRFTSHIFQTRAYSAALSRTLDTTLRNGER